MSNRVRASRAALSLRAETSVSTRWRKLLMGAALTLSSACGEDEPQPMIATSTFDAAVVVADAGFPNPVFVPPPTMTPAVMDAGTVAARADAGADANALRADAGRAPEAGQIAALPEGGVPSTDPNAGNPCGNGPAPLAANIRISEIAMYQVVKVSLYNNDAWVSMPNAALVQNKKSVVRVFVAPQTGFAPHTLRGILSLNTDGRTNVIVSDKMIASKSTDDSTASTFEFPIDAALVGGSTDLSVSVVETTCMAPANPAARVPATGSHALNADAIGKFKVVVVPVTLSGRTPDVSAAQLEKFRSELLAYYPVAEVEVTARAPVSYSGTVQSSGSGWSEVLSLVGRTRQQDAPASSVYYFGVITPAATFREYCRSGCVAGLAPQTTMISRSNQIGLGVGYVDPTSASTMAHELGHAHGLPHAPCTKGGSIEGADTKFPYAGAKIGVWGWDSRVNKYMSPMTYVDLMSYCDPVWISDYNYAKIATRAKAVNTVPLVYGSEQVDPHAFEAIIVRADGTARWSGMSESELPGEPSSARALDAQGNVVAEMQVARVSLSQTGDSFLYVPAPKASWAAIDLGDHVLQLSAIGSAAQ